MLWAIGSEARPVPKPSKPAVVADKGNQKDTKPVEKLVIDPEPDQTYELTDDGFIRESTGAASTGAPSAAAGAPSAPEATAAAGPSTSAPSAAAAAEIDKKGPAAAAIDKVPAASAPSKEPDEEPWSEILEQKKVSLKVQLLFYSLSEDFGFLGKARQVRLLRLGLLN
eukprot:s169_g22.t1